MIEMLSLMYKNLNNYMRNINDITEEEISKVNEILKDEYNYSPLKTASHIQYRCFTKSHAIYSGCGVVKVYEYLKSINIDICS